MAPFLSGGKHSHANSGRPGTDLDLQLRRRKIETIILCGITTNIEVEATAS